MPVSHSQSPYCAALQLYTLNLPKSPKFPSYPYALNPAKPRKAISTLNGTSLDGRQIKVTEWVGVLLRVQRLKVWLARLLRQGGSSTSSFRGVFLPEGEE